MIVFIAFFSKGSVRDPKNPYISKRDCIFLRRFYFITDFHTDLGVYNAPAGEALSVTFFWTYKIFRASLKVEPCKPVLNPCALRQATGCTRNVELATYNWRSLFNKTSAVMKIFVNRFAGSLREKDMKCQSLFAKKFNGEHQRLGKKNSQ